MRPVHPAVMVSAMLFLLLLISAGGVLYLYIVSAPPPDPASIVHLECADCAAAGMPIYIWRDPARTGVVGNVPHGTEAVVLGEEMYRDLLHYRVRARGITGWVSTLMVKR